MRKLKLLIATLALVVGGVNYVNAQTDVTSLYLTNAGFDNSSDYVTTNVYTYASDANNNNAVSSCQDVTGWTKESTGDGKAGGAFQWNSGYWIAGTSYIVPSTDSNGGSTGGALGLAGCWGNSAGYYQTLTLPAGLYRISYKVYNAGTNKIANYENTFGFVEDAGTTHYADMEFYGGEWTEGVVFLDLASPTSGKIHLGYTCANVGSGDSPKLFVDYVKIEVYNPALGYAIEDKTSFVGTTNSSWGCSNNNYTAESISGSEKFQWAASLSTGEQNSQTVTVPNGKYQISVYAGVSSTSGRDNTSNVITDFATTYVSFHANSISHGVPAYNRTTFSKYDRIELNDVEVTDGTLKMYLNEDVAGPNWLVLQIKKLLYLNSSAGATINYGTANFPIVDATSVTADYWYAYTVSLDGNYKITSSAATTVYYTQDGTQNASGGTYSSVALTAATASDAIALTAGTLYVKASEATTLTIEAATYSYEVGSATADVSFIQEGNTVTISYADLATNDPDATISTDLSGVTFNGTAVTCTATANGFTFTVPTVSVNTQYSLSIPANAIGYATGSTYNAAQTISFWTPAVFDGFYFVRNSAGKYISRGGDYNSRAILDEFGLPLSVATNASGITQFTYVDNNGKLFLNGSGLGYTDAQSPADWQVGISEGGCFILHANDGDYKDKKLGFDENLKLLATEDLVFWTFEPVSDHNTYMEALKDAQAATAATAIGQSTITTKSALETWLAENRGITPVTVDAVGFTEKWNGNASAEWGAGKDMYTATITDLPEGLYKLTVNAYYRLNGSATAAEGARGNVYLYGGDVKTQLYSIHDFPATTAWSGNNQSDSYGYYPDNATAGAAATTGDNYLTELYVYHSGGDFTYGIHQPSRFSNGQWFGFQNFTLSLYETKATTAEQEALVQAISTAKSGHTLGFENGEYAPYNNAASLEAIAAAEAVDGSTASATVVNNATASLQNLSWTANTGDVECVYNGNFELADAGGWERLAWTRSSNWGTRVEYGDPVQYGYYNQPGSMQYGNNGVYTLPLKAQTIYRLQFKYAKWDGDFAPTASVLNGENGMAVQTFEYASSNYQDGFNSVDMVFVTAEAGNYVLSLSATTNHVFTDVSITKATNQYLDFADGSVPTYAPGTYPSVKITRTLTANRWATAVYPFAVSGVNNIAVLDSYDASTGALGFTTASASTANVPFLMKSTAGASEISLSNVEVAAASAADAEANEAKLIGVYTQTSVNNEDSSVKNYVISNNEIRPVGTANVAPYRAYIQVTQPTGEARALTFFIDGDETTGIEGISVENENGTIYNLNGQRVDKAQRGLYIKNGKKVIVK